jgi:hypothetical protein
MAPDFKAARERAIYGYYGAFKKIEHDALVQHPFQIRLEKARESLRTQLRFRSSGVNGVTFLLQHSHACLQIAT